MMVVWIGLSFFAGAVFGMVLLALLVTGGRG